MTNEQFIAKWIGDTNAEWATIPCKIYWIQSEKLSPEQLKEMTLDFMSVPCKSICNCSSHNKARKLLPKEDTGNVVIEANRYSVFELNNMANDQIEVAQKRAMTKEELDRFEIDEWLEIKEDDPRNAFFELSDHIYLTNACKHVVEDIIAQGAL